MKRSTIALSVLFLATVPFPTGCNQGSVAVSEDAAPSGAPSGTAAPDTAGGGSPRVSVAEVYFDAFQTTEGALGHAIGIGFLPADSEVTSAFELRLSCALNGVGNACLFAADQTGIAYVEPGLPGTTLERITMGTLARSLLYRFAAPLKSVATDPTGLIVAVSDGSDTVRVSYKGVVETPISIPNAKVMRLQGAVSPKGDPQLLVVTDTQALIYQVARAGSEQSGPLPYNDEAVLDPAGSGAAWLETAAGQSPPRVGHLELATGMQRALALPAGNVSDLAFAGSDSVVFRLDVPGTGSELDRMDLGAGTVERVAQLLLDANVPEGIVCPSFADGRVYFGDRQGGGFAIFAAARATDGNWEVSPFAVPDQPATSFVCPRAVPGELVMKPGMLAFFIALGSVAHADPSGLPSLASSAAMSPAKYDQPLEFLSLQAGEFHPASLVVSNGSYSFKYGGGSLDSYLAEATFGHRLFRGGSAGSLFFEGGFSYSGFSGESAQSPVISGSTLHLNILGLDGRLGWFADQLPVAWLIPFVDAGGQLGFYFQSGATDFDSAQGTTTNFVGGAGLRFWLNPSSLDRDYFARSPGFPIYLSLKVNHVFPSGSALDLASTDWLAGLTVGL